MIKHVVQYFIGLIMTLISKFVTVNPYTKTQQTILVAKDRAASTFEGSVASIIKNIEKEGHEVKSHVADFKGSQLAGVEYEQLMPYLLPLRKVERAFHVVVGDFVTTEDGTGVVHISPTFGADDFRVAEKNDIPAMAVLDEAGVKCPLQLIAPVAGDDDDARARRHGLGR